MNHGRYVYFYTETGRKHTESLHEQGNWVSTTKWRFDGSLSWQGEEYRDTIAVPDWTTVRQHPPWLWGMTDQSEPTMPAWMKDDEKWQAALDAQE